MIRSTEAERIAFFDVLRAATEFHDPAPTDATITTDPDDEPIATLAVSARADRLCTLDQHFHDPDAKATLYANGVQVVTDFELLQELRSAPPA